MFKSYKLDWMDGLDWILLRSLVLLEHLAVLKMVIPGVKLKNFKNLISVLTSNSRVGWFFLNSQNTIGVV